jgi:hypothetical protein
MNHAKRRVQQPAAQPCAGDAILAPGQPLTVDLGGWRLTVRTVPSTTPAARAPDAAFWNGPGLYARRIARRH